MSNILEKTIFSKTTIPVFSKLADLSTLRGKLISSNIANVNTPDYKRKEINFDGELRKALKSGSIPMRETHSNHIPLMNSTNRAPKINEIEHTENSTGVNSVDVDEEMANMAQNQIIFNFSATMLGKKFKAIKSVIRGRF